MLQLAHHAHAVHMEEASGLVRKITRIMMTDFFYHNIIKTRWNKKNIIFYIIIAAKQNNPADNTADHTSEDTGRFALAD